MHFLDTYKFKMDWINSIREKVASSFYRRSWAAKSVVRGKIWPNFELILALMYVIITFLYMYEKDPINTVEKKWKHRLPHYMYMGYF